MPPGQLTLYWPCGILNYMNILDVQSAIVEAIMFTKLYTVYDKLAEESGPIFCAPNTAVAQRQYRNLTKDMENPKDFTLHYLGTFDSVAMLISAHAPEDITNQGWQLEESK